MKYKVILSIQAIKHTLLLRKNDPGAYKKIKKLLEELRKHPKTGTGKPERLKGNRSGQWSRRISKKHRLIYTINDDIIEVYVISAYGHYDDK